MKSLGAIVVGIGNYRYDSQQFPLLRFAANDAEEITKYLTACWAKPTEATIIRIADELATAEAIADAFTRLGQDAPYDLQFVFLSGHALTDSLRTAFVTQPVNGSSALDVIDDARLDQLLFSVPAKQTVLILDCCHAEGITRRMSFFRALEESDAHLFIASSREQQLTWEDELIGHGIFTAHLLDLLKTGSSVKLNGVRDQLDVDSELFPVLCDQVPLYVLEHKQQRQEPVKGGVSVRAVTLPVVRAARRIRSRTALGTAIRRLRQIVLGTAVLAIVFLGFVYTLAYYAQADRKGDIYLRHGTKWLAPVFRLFPTVRSDTGISSNDLSGDPASRYAIQAGETFGFWTHMSRQGYRDWYENIRSGLDAKAIARYDVLVATGTTRPVYRLNDDSRPSEVSFAAWALLDNSDSNQIKTLFSHLMGADRTSPLLTPFSANDLDFNILDRTQHDLSEFADALRATAALDPDDTFIAYLGFLKANQVWLAHSSTEQHGNEAQRRAADDVADVFAAIARAKADRGGPPVDSEMSSALNKLVELGYGDLVHLALSRVATSPREKNAAALQALSAFHGNSAEPDEAAAIRRLKDSLDSTVSSQAIVEKAYRRFVSVGGPEQSDLSGFLIAAADKRALPTSVLAILLDKAQITVTRHDSDFIDSEHARILAHAMSQVPESSRPLVYQLIDLVTAGVTPMATRTAEIYTALGRQGFDTPAMFQRIVAEARAAPPFQPENPDVVAEPLPGLSIVVGHGPWLEALAVLGDQRTLPPEAVEILEKHAIDPSLHTEIVRALARQPAFLNGDCSNSDCARMLRVFPRDGIKRQLASDVLAEQLAKLPHDKFLEAIDNLRNKRASELEPEVRIALTLSIINAQLARVRTTPVGSQLFE